jgi:hypothetical protein
MKVFAQLVFGLVLVMGCQISKKSEKNDRSYSFSENGCNTGSVSYRDQADLCDALKDPGRNRDCAERMRLHRFKTEKCPGSFY